MSHSFVRRGRRGVRLPFSQHRQVKAAEAAGLRSWRQRSTGETRVVSCSGASAGEAERSSSRQGRDELEPGERNERKGAGGSGAVSKRRPANRPAAQQQAHLATALIAVESLFLDTWETRLSRCEATNPSGRSATCSFFTI